MTASDGLGAVSSPSRPRLVDDIGARWFAAIIVWVAELAFCTVLHFKVLGL